VKDLSNHFVTVIVTTAVATLMRRMGRCLGNDTDGMFSTGLSANGAAPVTHYISSGQIYTRFVDLLSDSDALYTLIQERCAANGQTFPYTKANLAAALALCDISKDLPFDAMRRMGLQMVNDP